MKKSIYFLKQNFICYLFLFLLCAPFLQAYYDESDREQRFHNGIEYCECFTHCRCFGISLKDYKNCYRSGVCKHLGGFDREYGPPRNLMDQAWHEFMKGIIIAKSHGPYFPCGYGGLEELVNHSAYSVTDCVHFFSEYLDIIENFRKILAQARLDQIEHFKRRYRDYKNAEKLLSERLDELEQDYKKANQILDEIPSTIMPLYREGIKDCPHRFECFFYEKGLMSALEGKWDEALIEIQNFIDQSNKDDIEAEVYKLCGEACLELNLFNEAIQALTTAINKDPENKQAYFHRASAYFETGKFDEALADYLLSDKGNKITKASFLVSKEFAASLLNGVYQGSLEAAIEFFPSLCSSAYGLGKTLWMVNPLNSENLNNMNHFVNACYETTELVVDYCKNIDAETFEEYAEQVKILYERFDQLNESEKGLLVGHAIGKYGVDIFAGGIAIKAVSNYKKLRTANRLCNLETMAISNANKEAVVASSLKHASEREAFFKNVKYNYDAHNKHILGHNDYNGTRSIWNHKDPEGLVRRFGGTGYIKRGYPGSPGYKETVDFQEYIGIWKNADGTIELPTTRGVIHYGKKGAHIVPSNPNPKFMKK